MRRQEDGSMGIKGMASLAGILAVLAAGVTPAVAGGDKGRILVSAVVLGNVSQKVVQHPSQFTVTTEDLVRGFVEVPVATILEVKSNERSGYFLNFGVAAGPVRSMEVSLGNRTVVVTGLGGLVHQAYPGIAGETVQIRYRLFLSSDAAPGNYPWPVAVSASLL